METKIIGDNFSVDIRRVKGNKLPFVDVEFICKNGKIKKGVMVLDSCCIQDMFFADVAKELADDCLMPDNKVKVKSMGNASTTYSCANVEFVLGGTHFQSVMGLDQRPFLGMVNDLPILGILGNIFLQKYKLAIDFSDFTLHKSRVNHDNFCIADSSFFFIMDLGICVYGVPVLLLSGKNSEIVALADTGASLNVITKDSITQAGVEYTFTDEKQIVEGISETDEAKMAIVDFDINGLAGNCDECKLHHSKDQFAMIDREYLLSGNVMTDVKTSDNPNIEAILGCPFMAEQGWTLDFGSMIIFKRK